MVESVDCGIDGAKQFPHLSAAPIVEAVIHWQARAERRWGLEELRAELTKRLPEYSKLEPQHEILLTLEASMEGPASSSKASQKVGWTGFRISSADGLHIAQFTREGLVFSRLRPYPKWAAFEAEGRRLWRVFTDLAAPSQIQRLGVRFINRIPVRAIDSLGEYLREPPTRPLSLPLKNFLYQSMFEVPTTDFGVNVVKTLQTSESGGNVSHALIVDTDVFTKRPMPCEEKLLDDRLPKMRQLKNAVFFGLLTEKAIRSF
jgi:uncharacterized protein (TIGR04255 family)